MELNAKQILAKAKTGGYAVGAFNAANWETLKAIFNAAEKLHSPAIIETSPGETDYLGAENLVCLVDNFRARTGIPILINLDHALETAKVYHAAKAGYDLLHYDGSKLSFEVNLKHAKEVVSRLHRQNKLVEVEINHITGGSEAHRGSIKSMQNQADYTTPDQAKMFMAESGADILAVSIGNVHGIYRDTPKLDIKRLKQIAAGVSCFFSLHGGSGIPAGQVRAAIKHGVVKVNVNTELRLAFRDTLAKVIKTNKEAAVYKFMPDVISAVQKVVETKMKMCGSVNKK
ncbi:TPA: ketose-bisphosphate aldolase [Candidatus Falkowbacteria bacterium]|nr:ketose-bisphosphate aldolase [Candidatus Falkowbacteria bacterium]